MTTTKQIRAALDAATPGPWRRSLERSTDIDNHDGAWVCEVTGGLSDARLIDNAPAWIAWCLEQIEARDALLRRFVDHYAGGHDDYCSGCHRNCAEARKILEESK